MGKLLMRLGVLGMLRMGRVERVRTEKKGRRAPTKAREREENWVWYLGRYQ